MEHRVDGGRLVGQEEEEAAGKIIQVGVQEKSVGALEAGGGEVRSQVVDPI